MNFRFAGVLALALLTGNAAHAADSAVHAAREQAYEHMASARRAEVSGGFKFGQIQFGTDDHSRLMLFLAWQIAQTADDEIDWRVGSGKFVTIKVREAKEASEAMTLWIEQLFSKEKVLVDKIAACRDVKCVESVKW